MLDPQRILITGASGFVGTWLLSSLRVKLSPEDQIYALGQVNVSQSFGDTVHWHNLDIRDGEAVDALIATIRPTALVHLAAQSHVQEAIKSPALTWVINLNGTMNLANAVMHHSPNCRFIFVSSSEVYGGAFKLSEKPLNEMARLDPENPYAASKAAADLFIGQMARQGLQAVRFRPFNHTGPGQSTRFVVPSFASQVVRAEQSETERTITVGNLSAVRDFLDVRDVVDAYTAAILKAEPIEPGTILNLASGQPRRIGSILEALVAKSKITISIEIDEKKFRPNDTPFAAGDATLAKEILEWKPTITWDQTLDDILSDLQKQHFEFGRSLGSSRPPC
jgi:GDP-4-dehydro-6-deoxy-D-mannose reductase